jgi:hypothetical protein
VAVRRERGGAAVRRLVQVGGLSDDVCKWRGLMVRDRASWAGEDHVRDNIEQGWGVDRAGIAG